MYQSTDRFVLADFPEDVGDDLPRSMVPLFDMYDLVEAVADFNCAYGTYPPVLDSSVL